MHCFAILLALGLTWTGLPAGWAQDDPADEVTVPDAALRAVLEDSLGLSSGDPIPAASLAKLTVLVAPDAGIVDLTGLEHATGLTRLHLGPRPEQLPWSNSNDVSDLSPLSGLTGLTWLHLAGNSVADVTPLSGLTGLTFLNLQVNEVAEVSSLSGLTDLADLYLAFNPLRDASSLSGLTGLSVHDLPRPLQYPELGSSLNSRVEGYQASSPGGQSAVSGQGGQGSTPTVPVRIRTNSRDSVDTVARFLKGRGIASNTWRSDGGDGVQGLLWARVPVSLLVLLSEQPGVVRVREVLEAIPQQGQSEGSSTTASSAHGATAWRIAGIRGDGIKVGVLDIGFHGFGDLMEVLEELNPSYHTYCYADEADTVADSTGLGDCGDDPHGTDVTRALLDIAPNVELYISKTHKTMGQVQNNQALDWMIRNGVQVINYSVNNHWDGPGDGTSPNMDSPLKLVDTAVNSGIVWVNAAGNDARRTWYSNSPNFDSDGYLVFPGPTVSLPIRVNASGPRFALRWKDAWTSPAINLDLFLYHNVPGSGLRLAGSATGSQTGDRAVPMEILMDTESPIWSAGQYWLSVRRLRGSSPGWVQLQDFSGRSDPWQDASMTGSIGNPAESANTGMLAVGAADISDPPGIKDYSARGPAPEPTPGGRIKPDLVGGLESGESGTSIAAPRVAGLAALVIQELGDIHDTPKKIADYLKSKADRHSSPNNTWGHGFAKLPPPVAAPKEGSAHASAEGIEVRWKAVPAAAGYRLEFQRQLVRGTSGWSEYAWLATLANESLPSADMRVTFQHTPSTERHPLDGDYRYRYRVRSLPAGAWSTDIPVGPSAPRNFKAEAGDGQVLLTWAAPGTTGGSPLLGYHYREIVPGDTTAWFDFLKGWTRYLPQELSNGVAHTFEVRAYTGAAAGASVDTTVTPAGAPRAPGDFEAAPGDGQVALSWTAADSNGAPITAYEVQYAPKSDPGAEVDWSNVTWSEVPGDSTARDTTITGLSHGTPYGFRVAARNRVNLGTPAEKEATPLGNRPPVITAPDTVWFAEHRTDSVATLSASDPEGQAVTWSHTGADVGLFKVQGDTLSFKMTPDFPSPDFEAPRDVDEDNFYEVTLTATDDGEPAASASHDMTVAVTNAPEAGTVTLSTTQPRVGMHLTATLTDPDQGVTNDRWSWEELGGASSAGQRTQPPAQSQRYTVEDRVKGRRLVAKVAYTDGHGPDQAVSDTTAAVRANVPGAPGGLQAEPGDGRVTLRWTAADSNGAWITGYAYRDSAHTAGSTWSAWPETALIAGDATSHPVTGLDNGTGYTFEVRAVNPVGAGPASSPASATPRRADTAGAIDLSHSTPPKVNQQMTATLRDPDDPQLATAIWRWDRVGASSSTDEGATGAVDQGNTYTPGSGDVGYQIRVTVTYTDNYGSHTVRKTTEDAVTATECVITVSEVSKTDVPENSTPTVGVYEATANSLCGTLTWSRTGSDAGSFVLRAVTGQPNQRSLHFVSAPDYEAKRIYSVTIRVADPSGRAGTFPRTVRVTDVNEPPVITGPANKSVPENTPTTATVATYSATDPEDDSVSWDLSGTDEDDFQISSGGALRFGSTPNYEAAADANTDNSYKVTVVATDDGSPAASSSKPVTVTVTDVNEPPSLTGLTTVTRDENGTSPWTVTPYSASDPDNNTLHFTHRGDQASYFQLTGSGSSRTLEFKSQPNYETRQTYKVRVVVRDRSTGGLKDSVSTTVTLNDIDDPGRVVITNTAPRVGQQITAKLYDEDGDVANDLWFWVALASGASGTQSQRPDATSHVYTIKAKDVGKVLEATVEYDDGDGPGKTAHTTSNTVSASAPGAPKSFTASRGDGEVYLSWGEAEDNGSDIIHYETRSKAQTASSWSGWSEATKGADARADTFSSLTNGTAYSFEVRAENDQGEGPAASDAATPATLPGAPPNLATDRQGGNGFMELTWGAAPANGSPVLHYYYRYKKTGDDDWRGWYRRAGGANARSKSWSNFDDGSAYVFQVRARNAVGYGTTAQISASALGPGGSTDDEGAGGHEETEDELMPEGEVPEPGEDEVVVVAKPVAEGPAGWLAAADSLAVRSAPNPFNPSTTLHFQLPEAGPVTLTVYNVAGQVVARLVRGEILGTGLHTREWHGTDERGRPLASGLYLYRLIASGQLRVGKLALIR